MHCNSCNFNSVDVPVPMKKINGKIKMKKHIGLSAVVAGMLLGMPSLDPQAAVAAYRPGSRATFVINT